MQQLVYGLSTERENFCLKGIKWFPLTKYWLRVRRAVRRRATGRNGMVRCERSGSEKGPFDYQHSTKGYRYLGEEIDHLELIRYLCRACHQFRHSHGANPMVQPTWEELE